MYVAIFRVCPENYLFRDPIIFSKNKQLYGQANRRGELPDKISQRLEADAAKFDEAAKKGDQAGMRAVLDKYFEDLPKDGKEPFGSGKAAE